MKKLAKVLAGVLIISIITSPTIMPRGQLKAEETVEQIKMIDNSAEGIPNFLIEYYEEGVTKIYIIINGELKELEDKSLYRWVDIVSLGNLKFRFTGKPGYGEWSITCEFPGTYMIIYKYDPQKQEFVRTSDMIRFTTDHYQDYPFSKPYAITNQEVIDIINGAYECLHDCFYHRDYFFGGGEVEGMELSYFYNKKEFITMLETYWSPEAANHIMNSYSHYWKEIKGIYDNRDLFIRSDIRENNAFKPYLNIIKYDPVNPNSLNIQRTLVKVEDYSDNLKKVYTTETDANGKTTNKSYLLKFCDRGWVVHQDGVFN